MKRSLSLIVIIALAAAFSLAGCAAETPDIDPTPSPEVSDEPHSGVGSTLPGTERTPKPVTPLESGAATLQTLAPPPSAETPPAFTTHAPDVSENRVLPTRVPILYYHSISDQPVGIRELSVTVKDFEAQMRYLAENGYTAITFADLDDFTSFEKPVIITLDDGYADNYSNAYPILKKYGFQATIFIISGLIDTAGYLTREEMAEMTDIISFQGHTVMHENLTKLSPEKLEAALTVPKETISAITNAPVYVFAYPTGYYNDAVKSAVSEHYAYAVTINQGYYEDGSDKLLILRLYIHRDLQLEGFIDKLG